MSKSNDIVTRVAKTLKEPVEIDPDFTRRVMSAIEDVPPPHTSVGRFVFDWLRRRHTVSLSPLGGLVLAAGLVGVVLAGSRLIGPAGTRESANPLGEAAAQSALIQFVFVAPEANTVVLVGDFNDWDAAATPLVQDEGRGMWSVTVPLGPGRYRYSFLVDGSVWAKDPQAVPAVEDEFGRPNSVLTIGGV